MNRKLTPKQRKFVNAYIEDSNASKAYYAAGYKPRSEAVARANASRLLTNANVKQAIDERMAELASKRIMDAREAVELLTRIARGEEKETVISSTPDGVYESKKEADLKTRITAVKEILKRYPDNDKLTEQQLRKLRADADIAEARAKEVRNAETNEGQTLIVDDVRGIEDEDTGS